MLAEALAAEERKAVAYPGGYAGYGKNGDPNAVFHKRELVYYHYGDKRICKHTKACESAGGAHALGYDTCGHDREHCNEKQGFADDSVGLEPDRHGACHGIKI